MSHRWLSPVVAVLLFTQPHFAPAQDLQTSPHAEGVSPETAGDLLFARGEFVEALDAYSRAPVDAATLNKIGVVWQHLSAVEQAKHNYEEALALRPNFPDALNNLGAVYFAEKKYTQAIRLYRRALELAPDSPITTANLGTAYFAQGRTSQGVEAYRTAFSLDSSVFDPDSASLVEGPLSDEGRARLDYSIAELFAQMHRNDRALDYLRRAFDAGFEDSKRLWQDPAFAELRITADFAALTAQYHLK
ncbi:MAG TPA: tetratricopeptide repeat protein [Acidobacteriaceae bacterium]|nr:tetratricopeptide repeat protein [Acidobacteriaceae bacterium]